MTRDDLTVELLALLMLTFALDHHRFNRIHDRLDRLEQSR
jgi:hypothetical protein